MGWGRSGVREAAKESWCVEGRTDVREEQWVAGGSPSRAGGWLDAREKQCERGESLVPAGIGWEVTWLSAGTHSDTIMNTRAPR